jgi:CheY-like chemotaxis protein
LANEPYDIVECNNDTELLSKLESEKPSLVFLDFTLSDEKSGYDLSKEIKNISPNTKVLIMYGTFDTIDDGEFNQSGASEKIVKPFDSTKFINICRNLINEPVEDVSESIDEDSLDDLADSAFPDDLPEDDIPEPIEEFEDGEDDWVVNAPLSDEVSEELPPIQELEEDESLADQSMNPLESEVADWGMEVPAVIGESGEEDNDILPPVISESAQSSEPAVSPQELVSMNENNIVAEGDDTLLPDDSDLEYPDDSDLEYPDMGDIGSIEDDFPAPIEDKPASSGPSLVSMDNLNNDIQEEEPQEQGTESDEELRNLEDQIADEAEEDDLWSVDEVSATQEATTSQIEDVDLPDDIPEDDIPTPVDSLDDLDTPIYEDNQVDPPTPTQVAQKDIDAIEPAVNVEDIPAAASNIDIEDIVTKVMSKVESLLDQKIEEALNKKLTESTEKVAWDVIPELAENLIRDEIKKISDNVLNN